MPDISMCSNKDCPSRSVCYRAVAKPSPHRQSYMDFKLLPGAKLCGDFWPLEGKR